VCSLTFTVGVINCVTLLFMCTVFLTHYCFHTILWWIKIFIIHPLSCQVSQILQDFFLNTQFCIPSPVPSKIWGHSPWTICHRCWRYGSATKRMEGEWTKPKINLRFYSFHLWMRNKPATRRFWARRNLPKSSSVLLDSENAAYRQSVSALIVRNKY